MKNSIGLRFPTWAEVRAFIVFTAPFIVFITLLALSAWLEFRDERSVLHFSDVNPEVSGPKATANVRIEKVDETLDMALGTVEISYPVPITVTKIISVEFEILNKESIVGRTGIFTLESTTTLFPTTWVEGKAPFQWNLADGSTPASRFPFDEYKLELSRAYLVIFSQPGTTLPADGGDVRTVESLNLSVSAPNLKGPKDQDIKSGWQLGKSNGQQSIPLQRPDILKVLTVIYALFGAVYTFAILKVLKEDGLSAILITIFVSIFGVRQTLTQGAAVFPCLVDYVLLAVIACVGIAITIRLTFPQPKPSDPPAH